MAWRIESLGWGFYAIVLVILYGPVLYLISQVTREDTAIVVRLGMAFVAAMFAAAIIAWAANAILQTVLNKRRAAAQSQSKNKSKNKGKKKKP
ncbi:MAG: hypothetical protein ACLFV4_01355 [Candidatus Hydrogenedentota bacterium]